MINEEEIGPALLNRLAVKNDRDPNHLVTTKESFSYSQLIALFPEKGKKSRDRSESPPHGFDQRINLLLFCASELICSQKFGQNIYRLSNQIRKRKKKVGKMGTFPSLLRTPSLCSQKPANGSI